MRKYYEVDLTKPKPEWCTWCDIPNPGDDHWKWGKNSKYKYGGVWRCHEYSKHHGRLYYARCITDPARKVALKAYQKEYYARNPEYLRYKAYRILDRKRGIRVETIPWDNAKPIMLSPCSYCGLERAGGLDRIDNELGHSAGNVIAACGNCNMILSDMPMELKQMFIPTLTLARQKGLFDLWQHPSLRNLKPRVSVKIRT